MCGLFPASIGKFACSPTGFCNNWDHFCGKFSNPFLCNPIVREVICSFCATFNFTDLCDPFDMTVLPFWYRFQYSGQYAAMDFGSSYMLVTSGIVRPQDLAIALENVAIVWFHNLVQMIVPFYHIFSDFLLKHVMGPLGQSMVQIVFGPNRMPLRFAREMDSLAGLGNVTAVLYAAAFGSFPQPVTVAHSHFGVVSRAIARKRAWYAVSFEGSQLELSPIEHFFGELPPASEGFVVNEVSGKTMWAMIDEFTMSNYRLPGTSGFTHPTNPYETFCLVAAGCVSDDRYDHICNETVGWEQYRQFFTLWNRNRSRIVPRT
jgi:hypothetical protein